VETDIAAIREVLNQYSVGVSTGDFGLTRCKYTLKMTPKAGGETINAMPEGKALTLYERQSDGSWKIAFDCFNSSVAPQPE